MLRRQPPAGYPSLHVLPGCAAAHHRAALELLHRFYSSTGRGSTGCSSALFGAKTTLAAPFRQLPALSHHPRAFSAQRPTPHRASSRSRAATQSLAAHPIGVLLQAKGRAIVSSGPLFDVPT